ncbi:hypothetical protein RXV86_07740 [Alisedimentitalea sp. MJ-SS2]|uniref:hypothetical protein n=1 Tax=Aliisedimentitalea sp. MJ-SS2 TaxID=3049795 RepID=UPI0029154B6B|nr:hypothetical protein [Alisedimentitalea sp. MJ-SS2]MDU8927272.1 hypothetical protein [Alisedimentitalea sp. MJ-SS2]
MQLLEFSIAGLRSARHGFGNPDHPARVTLFPMVHVGEADFFQRVYDDAFDHDVVLFEGVRSPVVRNITRAYRWINVDRLGLVVQPRTQGYPGKAREVHADLSPEEFHAVWRQVPLWLRLAAHVVAPLMGVKKRFTATRENIGRRLGLDDYSSRNTVMSWSPETAGFHLAILTARDERLCEALHEVLKDLREGGGSVAIVYGAMHMQAVIRMLDQQGFRVRESAWMTVFSA